MADNLLNMVINMAKEYGLEETLKVFLNMVPEPPSLVAVQEGFHDVVRGDHLVHKTSMGWNIHFYVVENLGDGNLKVCGCFIRGNNNLLIEEGLIFKPGQAQGIKVEERILCKANVGQSLKKKLYEQTSILHDEECRIDIFKKEKDYYDFLCNNSEHFITFVKTGEAKCQIATQIECFISKHIFVQAIHADSGITDGSWAAVVGALCEIILKNSNVKLSIREALIDTLAEIPKAATTQASRYIGLRATEVQTTKGMAKETVKGGEKIIVVRTKKSATKKIVKVGGKTASVQATKFKSTGKKALREGGKTITIQAARDASTTIVGEGGKAKEDVKRGGKATAAIQATKGVVKHTVKEEGKITEVQPEKSAVMEVLKEGEATTFQTATEENDKEGEKVNTNPTRNAIAEEIAKEGEEFTKEGEKAVTDHQAKNVMVEETMKERENANTDQGVNGETVKEKEKVITDQPTAEGIVKEEGKSITTNDVAEEVIKEGELNANANQTTNGMTSEEIVKEGENSTTDQGEIVKKKGTDHATNSISEEFEVVNEGDNISLDQVVNEEIVKEGEKSTTDQGEIAKKKDHSLSEEVVNEGDNTNPDQVVNEEIVKEGEKSTDQGEIVKKKGTDHTTNSISEEVVNEGDNTNPDQAVNEEIVKEGEKSTDQGEIVKKKGTDHTTNSISEEVVNEGDNTNPDQAVNEEIVKEGEKSTDQGEIVKKKGTDHTTNSISEEVMNEGDNTNPDQAVNEEIVKEEENTNTDLDEAMNGEIVKEKGENSTLDSLADDVAKEGGMATAVQATKSAATVAIQGASKEALKHGTKHTTTHIAKNTATYAIKHTANATVVAGLAIEGAIYSANMGKAIYNYSKGEMDNEEFIDYAVEQTATSGGSTVGGISGSLAGIAAGATIGSVIPVIGTVIGGTIGGFAGGISGGIGGTLLGKEIGKLINIERKKPVNLPDQMNAE